MPQTQAVRRPGPTKPAKPGSWPEPPPEMTATLEREEGGWDWDFGEEEEGAKEDGWR